MLLDWTTAILLTLAMCYGISPKATTTVCLFPLRILYWLGYNIFEYIIDMMAEIAERRRLQDGHISTVEEEDALWDKARALGSSSIRAKIIMSQASMWDTRRLPVDEIRAALAAQQQTEQSQTKHVINDGDK